MMMGIAQPLKWSEEDFFASAFFCPPDNLAKQDAISMQRHVVPVLFVSGNRKDYRRVLGQCGDLGPFHLCQLHEKF